MSTGTVRVTPGTQAILKKLAKESKQSMQELVARAVEQYRRQLMLQRANEVFAALRAQRLAWSEEAEERRIWDRAVSDGLETEK